MHEAGARKFGQFWMKRDGYKQRSTWFQCTEHVANAVEERVSRNEPLRNPRQVVAVLIVKVRDRLQPQLDAVRKPTAGDFGLRKFEHPGQHVEPDGTRPRMSLNEPDRDRGDADADVKESRAPLPKRGLDRRQSRQQLVSDDVASAAGHPTKREDRLNIFVGPPNGLAQSVRKRPAQ